MLTQKLIWTSEVRMYVDLNEEFFETNDNTIAMYLKKFREAMRKDLAEAIELGLDVAIISYVGRGSPIISEISDLIEKHKNLILIAKNKDWLISGAGCQNQDINRILQPVRKSIIKLRWLNTTWCVKSTWIELFENWFNVKISANKVINNWKIWSQLEFASYNYLSFIKERFQWYEDILDFEWLGPNDDTLLAPYF